MSYSFFSNFSKSAYQTIRFWRSSPLHTLYNAHTCSLAMLCLCLLGLPDQATDSSWRGAKICHKALRETKQGRKRHADLSKVNEICQTLESPQLSDLSHRVPIGSAKTKVPFTSCCRSFWLAASLFNKGGQQIDFEALPNTAPQTHIHTHTHKTWVIPDITVGKQI